MKFKYIGKDKILLRYKNHPAFELNPDDTFEINDKNKDAIRQMQEHEHMEELKETKKKGGK